MASNQSRNDYLDRVVAEQQVLEQNLRTKRAAPAPAPQAPRGRAAVAAAEAAPAKQNGVEVRVTGFWCWKTVLVPPNAFVVHTRRGKAEPLHVGLGTSFRYRPQTDAFLVVPGAMQTILISAFSICRELQGVVVQAYVQWRIEDFATAYRRLDFGDPDDPMRLVNLQLKEQAEAAIKDKVATMSVHEVLSDKQPIIEELTARLRAVAEGEGDRDNGLGLRIVTVQIKEAVVSSSRLWENLQKPYRAEQERVARLAELAAGDAISEREMVAARARETRRMADERELGELRHRNDAAGFDRDTAEKVRRAARDQEDTRTLADLSTETALHELALRRTRQAQEHEVERLRLEAAEALRALRQQADLAHARAETAAEHEQQVLQLERARLRVEIDNTQSDANVQAQFVEKLPELVRHLPKPTEVRTVNLGGVDQTSLSGIIAQLTAVLSALRDTTGRPEA
ncbi:hypothetical protein Val02_31720 [Virgisporangium aliadipatigenens]|uniref:Band 7 domain-containing protein n=1 Tax=Virgisporangium aliadipatigenens TaxID=741659 RepID=A0A8J4DQR5_9ACTN|nr:SPFH domain-containing protein [Virgisporangium aliadipatigenens]GIJ46286.1 hypothetical protein Val02_31720 [Virgisporangium aliadipatigenens]